MAFRLSIVTPQRPVVEVDVESVVVPGQEGDFGVLDDHEPFLAAVREGVLRHRTPAGESREVQIGTGFAEVGPHRLTILAQSGKLVGEAR